MAVPGMEKVQFAIGLAVPFPLPPPDVPVLPILARIAGLAQGVIGRIILRKNSVWRIDVVTGAAMGDENYVQIAGIGLWESGKPHQRVRILGAQSCHELDDAQAHDATRADFTCCLSKASCDLQCGCNNAAFTCETVTIR